MTVVLTGEQSHAIETVVRSLFDGPKGHVLMQAVAGSGKSATLVAIHSTVFSTLLRRRQSVFNASQRRPTNARFFCWPSTLKWHIPYVRG